jgi:acetyltransferase
MGPHPLTPLFDPKGVAVFGASASGRSVASRVFSNVLAAGFKGPLVPVNPKYAEVAGHACVPTLADSTVEVDLAVIATPADTVPGIIAQCGAAGVQHAVILSAGFGEAGTAAMARTRALADAARNAGVRFLGPNCVGLVRPHVGLDASFLAGTTPPGRLAFVSQSGALISAIADSAAPNHLGFSAMVSLGNAQDIDFGEVLDFLAQDARTDAILLYIEGIRDGAGFASALRAAARIKPVIVLKGGRSRASAEAAHTHTGAMIGSDAVFDAVLERAGAVRAMTLGQLFAAAEVLSMRRRAGGNRLAVITNGGGAGVLAADRATEMGVELPQPSQATLEALDPLLPPTWSRTNPLDLIGDAPPAAFGAAVAACLKDPAFDGVLAMLTPQAMTRPDDAAAEVIAAAKEERRKPVLVCWMGETSVAEARRALSAAGLADFDTPERAVEGFSHLARHARNQRLALETPAPAISGRPTDPVGARMIIDAALAAGRGHLSDIEAKAVMAAYGVPVGQTILARDPAEGLVAAQTLGFPVALKIASRDIVHKSDVGGVRLNVGTAADLRPAWRGLTSDVQTARPDARIEGVTVEAMAKLRHARELVVGAARDPVFGPTILFGTGGTMVEVLADSAVGLPPLTAVLAERLIDRTRASRLMQAVRNIPAADRAAVVDVLLRLSDLLIDLPQVLELDINPLLAGPSGVLAVDVRMRIARAAPGRGPYAHLAITPWPRHLVRQMVLPDGAALTIRPLRPEDAALTQAFVRALSPEARRYRFMQSIEELSPEMLARLTQIDYAREMALIAVTEEDGAEVQAGVARYVLNPDRTSCEFAVAVAEGRRGMGLGSRLMEALMDAARGQSLRRIEGEVLAENAPMLALMADLGFSTRRDADDPGVVHVSRSL